MSDADLFTELQRIAERVHVAMGCDDGYPEPFRDEVIVALMDHESDLDPDVVFNAVLMVANRANINALDDLYRDRSK
jgi:hypothetical protein